MSIVTLTGSARGNPCQLHFKPLSLPNIRSEHGMMETAEFRNSRDPAAVTNGPPKFSAQGIVNRPGIAEGHLV